MALSISRYPEADPLDVLKPVSCAMLHSMMNDSCTKPKWVIFVTRKEDI